MSAERVAAAVVERLRRPVAPELHGERRARFLVETHPGLVVRSQLWRLGELDPAELVARVAADLWHQVDEIELGGADGP